MNDDDDPIRPGLDIREVGAPIYRDVVVHVAVANSHSVQYSMLLLMSQD